MFTDSRILGFIPCVKNNFGRMAVRAINASMSASYHMLSTPAAPAPAAS
jgi:hypothetical protein